MTTAAANPEHQPTHEKVDRPVQPATATVEPSAWQGTIDATHGSQASRPDKAPLELAMLEAPIPVYVPGNRVNSPPNSPGGLDANKFSILDTLDTVLSKRFKDLDADHNGYLSKTELQVAAGDTKNFSDQERKAFQFALNDSNFQQLSQLYEYESSHTGDRSQDRHTKFGIDQSDLAVLHRALHPEDKSAADPFADGRVQVDVTVGLAGTMPSVLAAGVGGAFGGPFGAAAGFVAMDGLIVGGTDLVQRLIYGSSDNYYRKKALSFNSFKF